MQRKLRKGSRLLYLLMGLLLYGASDIGADALTGRITRTFVTADTVGARDSITTFDTTAAFNVQEFEKFFVKFWLDADTALNADRIKVFFQHNVTKKKSDEFWVTFDSSAQYATPGVDTLVQMDSLVPALQHISRFVRCIVRLTDSVDLSEVPDPRIGNSYFWRYRVWFDGVHR